MSEDTRVGPYSILRLINKGGQGSVYLGYDKRLQRRVAIKIYSLPSDRTARRDLLREAQQVASIQSPKVVQIHDVIESPEHLALVMEYVPGCDLEEFLTAVRPSLASVLSIAADIAGALAAARQQHIVHGDVKAGNILIAESGRVKLTDFGIARVAHGRDLPAAAAGSLAALSPEQCLGKPMDVRSDLFALGCLLYRMLTGVQPFFRDGQVDTYMLLEQSPRPVQEWVGEGVELPGELVALIDELLQKDPADRPGNTHRVRRLLRSASRQIPLAASNSLLQEARPCFRLESLDDIPPQIPAELGRAGRSLLDTGGQPGSGLRGYLARLGWPAQLAIGGLLVTIVGVALGLVLQRGETLVVIEPPALRVSNAMDLPRELSGAWLVEEVKLALEQQLGSIRVLRPRRADHSLVAAGIPQPDVEERLQLGLRCVEVLCVFTVSRERAGEQFNRQAVLFPDMSLQQWRSIVQGATAALYD